MEHISTFEELAEISAIFIGFIVLTSKMSSKIGKYHQLVKLAEFYMVLSSMLVLFMSLGALVLNANGMMSAMIWKVLSIIYSLCVFRFAYLGFKKIATYDEIIRKKLDNLTWYGANLGVLAQGILTALIVFESPWLTGEGAFLIILYIGLTNATLMITSLVLVKGSLNLDIKQKPSEGE